MTVIITLTTAGEDTGPFNLFSDANGYITAFALGITKQQLLDGYPSDVVPNGTTTIKVQSVNSLCTNFILLPTGITTTTTTSSSTTTTTSTTLPPVVLVPITLGFFVDNSLEACSRFTSNPVTKYIFQDNVDFFNALELYDDINGTILSPAGIYSDGTFYRTWNGIIFTGAEGNCNL